MGGTWKGIKKQIADKFDESQLRNQVAADVQKQFVDDIMEDEGVDREQALRWCLKQSD